MSVSRNNYAPVSPPSDAVASLFPHYSDETCLQIICEFQDHMHSDNWVYQACAVCGQEKFPVDITQVPVNNIPSHLWPTSYNFELYNHAILCPCGMLSTDSLDDLLVCSSCNVTLMKGVQPLDALANCQYYIYNHLDPDVLHAFSNASLHELQLMAACYASQISCLCC